MNHQQYKEWLQILFYDELGADEQYQLETHLHTCSDCQAAHEELKKLRSVLIQHKPIEISDQQLEEARRELHGALHRVRSLNSVQQLGESITRLLTERMHILPNHKIAFGGIAFLLLSLFLGYLAFGPPFAYRERETLSSQVANETPQSMRENTRISNLRFLSPDMTNGEVEFVFDAVMPVHMKGSVNNPEIQKMLAHAILNDQNAGVRLQSVSAIQTERLRQPDRLVKEALIQALKRDENAGVRKEALKALERFSFDDDIKNAFLYTLMHDKNPGLRIAAINVLDSLGLWERQADQDVLNVLRDKAYSDDNNYIRLRAKTVLQEVKRP